MSLPRFIVVALLTLSPVFAMGACSRPIIVPVSTIGWSVTISKTGVIGGVFPTLMKEIGDKIGCELRFTEVPRARLEMLFELGEADMLLAATQSEHRDQFGQFVPLIKTRAALVSIDSQHAPLASLAEVLAHKQISVALVRGFDYGPAYRALSEQLKAEDRLVLAKDPLDVARMLKAGIATATIMPPSALYGAASNDPRTADIAGRLRVEPMDELPWGLAGVYLSRKSLSPQDRAVLEEGLQAAARSGALYKAYKHYYPAAIFEASSHPL
jgi:polar amino acid transport system substrate-binding protein